jgi:ATP-dependent exoDNAse (exonuclease V) beta subunit
VLPETDVDAVRLMTIHAAKGLEFPMVVLSGMTSQPRNPSGVQLLWKPDGYAVKLTKSVQTNDFNDVQPIDEQMDAYERRRLLYVATTRARDHLVVSLHRGEAERSTTNAQLMADAGAGTAAGALALVRHPGDVTTATVTPPVAAPPDLIAWRQRIEISRRSAQRIPAQSASGLEGTEPAVALEPADAEPGLAKGGRDVELPPWSKGRYGSAIGRAVHGVLQVVDLATGNGIDDAVAAQCVAEGVVEHADMVRALAQSALDSDLVRRAATRPHWREWYVGADQDDGTVLEGFVDLIYREDDGALVIVDYKTDAIPAGAVASRVAYYEPQVRAYTEIAQLASDVDVRAALLFLTPTAAAHVEEFA